MRTTSSTILLAKYPLLREQTVESLIAFLYGPPVGMNKICWSQTIRMVSINHPKPVECSEGSMEEEAGPCPGAIKVTKKHRKRHGLKRGLGAAFRRERARRWRTRRWNARNCDQDLGASSVPKSDPLPEGAPSRGAKGKGRKKQRGLNLHQARNDKAPDQPEGPPVGTTNQLLPARLKCDKCPKTVSVHYRSDTKRAGESCMDGRPEAYTARQCKGKLRLQARVGEIWSASPDVATILFVDDEEDTPIRIDVDYSKILGKKAQSREEEAPGTRELGWRARSAKKRKENPPGKS